MLSLYFCCDGYADDEGFKEDLIAPVPVSYDSKEEVELRLIPNGRKVGALCALSISTSRL